MRILVTGPRIWTDVMPILDIFQKVTQGISYSEVTLIEGEATGFDTVAKNMGRFLHWNIEPYPVTKDEWYPNGSYDAKAGHKRNQRMVDSGADLAIAGLMKCNKANCRKLRPHITHGTADCIKRIKKAGIPLREITYYD